MTSAENKRHEEEARERYLKHANDRDKPMKVKNRACGNCGAIYLFHDAEFCDNCGQRLDWNKHD